MMKKLYLIFRHRNDALLAIAKTKKQAKIIQKEEDESIAHLYGYYNAREAKQHCGELTHIDVWEFDDEIGGYREIEYNG